LYHRGTSRGALKRAVVRLAYTGWFRVFLAGPRGFRLQE